MPLTDQHIHPCPKCRAKVVCDERCDSADPRLCAGCHWRAEKRAGRYKPVDATPKQGALL